MGRKRDLGRTSRILVFCYTLLVLGTLGLLMSCGNQTKSKPVVVWIKKTFVPEADDYLVKGFTKIGKDTGVGVEVQIVSSSNLAERYSALLRETLFQISA